MSRQFPKETQWVINNTLTNYPRLGSRYVPTKEPWCEPCNGGWMKRIEDSAIPVLVPLINGEHRIIEPDQQELIKLWMTLRAMVFDVHAERTAPRPRYFRDEEHFQIATTQTHDPFYKFYIGKYVGEQGWIREQPFDSNLVRNATNSYEGPVTRGYAVTLVFKHLVLQIRCIKSNEPFDLAEPPPITHAFEIGEPFGITFPPPFRFTDKSIDHFWKVGTNDV
jgi:hypothetical protein